MQVTQLLISLLNGKNLIFRRTKIVEIENNETIAIRDFSQPGFKLNI